jgi:hypothetical protein
MSSMPLFSLPTDTGYARPLRAASRSLIWRASKFMSQLFFAHRLIHVQIDR